MSKQKKIRFGLPKGSLQESTFKLFGKAGVVDVVVRGEGVADLAQGDGHPLEIRLHRAEGPRPADVNEQSRCACADNPVIG